MSSELSDFAARVRDFFRRAEARTEVDLEPAFDRLALQLFALQFRLNQPYREFCEARHVAPDGIARWTEIPAISTRAFKEGDLTCLPAHQRTAVFHSSGTTEHRPGRHAHSRESLAVYEASLWPWFHRHVLPDGKSASRCSLLVLTPSPARAPRSSLVHMFEVVRRKLHADETAFIGSVDNDGSWQLDSEALIATLVEATEHARPVVLLGTAFLFVHLLEKLMERELQFQLPAGSRLMETGGYKGRSRAFPKSELHSLLSARLGIPDSHIICEYGMSELSSQAYDRVVRAGVVFPAARRFAFPPWARARVVSPETGRDMSEGEAGLLQVFDLANVFSVMAIQTDDLAVQTADGFELLGRVEIVEPRGCSLMSL